MPLIRRPSPPSEPSAAAPASLTEGTSDQRWAAVRAAAAQPGGVALLAGGAHAGTRSACPRSDLHRACARRHGRESAAAVVPFIRSEDASLRAGALDALRAMPEASRPHVDRLLADPDADVRLLSCELVRGYAREGSQPAAERPARPGDREERGGGGGRSAGGDRPSPRRCRPWRAAPSASPAIRSSPSASRLRLTASAMP